MIKTIKNIDTTIDGENVGALMVNWDMDYYYDYDENGDYLRHNEVRKINSVELQLFDKLGIDIKENVLSCKRITEILEHQLLSDVEFKELGEIGGIEVKDPLFEMISNIVRDDALNRYGINLRPEA